MVESLGSLMSKLSLDAKRSSVRGGDSKIA